MKSTLVFSVLGAFQGLFYFLTTILMDRSLKRSEMLAIVQLPQISVRLSSLVSHHVIETLSLSCAGVLGSLLVAARHRVMQISWRLSSGGKDKSTEVVVNSSNNEQSEYLSF